MMIIDDDDESDDDDNDDDYDDESWCLDLEHFFVHVFIVLRAHTEAVSLPKR